MGAWCSNKTFSYNINYEINVCRFNPLVCYVYNNDNQICCTTSIFTSEMFSIAILVFLIILFTIFELFIIFFILLPWKCICHLTCVVGFLNFVSIVKEFEVHAGYATILTCDGLYCLSLIWQIISNWRASRRIENTRLYFGYRYLLLYIARKNQGNAIVA